jgi:hypothetical protein
MSALKSQDAPKKLQRNFPSSKEGIKQRIELRAVHKNP